MLLINNKYCRVKIDEEVLYATHAGFNFWLDVFDALAEELKDSKLEAGTNLLDFDCVKEFIRTEVGSYCFVVPNDYARYLFNQLDPADVDRTIEKYALAEMKDGSGDKASIIDCLYYYKEEKLLEDLYKIEQSLDFTLDDKDYEDIKGQVLSQLILNSKSYSLCYSAKDTVKEENYGEFLVANFADYIRNPGLLEAFSGKLEADSDIIKAIKSLARAVKH